MKNDWRPWSKFGRNIIHGDIMLSKDFKEFIELLNEHNVRYLVVGGYAVAFHGHPRYTKDIDLWIELSLENAEKILEALKEFGFGSLDLTPNPDKPEPYRFEKLNCNSFFENPFYNGLSECHEKFSVFFTQNSIVNRLLKKPTCYQQNKVI